MFIPSDFNLEPGRRFGKLTVIKEIERLELKNYRFRRQYLCKCDCGKETKARKDKLLAGTRVSCGCARAGNAKRKPKNEKY
jgi:hypothetical protein